MCRPVPPNLHPGDPTDPRRSQESQGVTVSPGSSRVTHRCSPSRPHGPSGSAGEFRLGTAAAPGDRVCAAIPRRGERQTARHTFAYLRREAGPLSCSRSAKRGTGDRMPHSSSTWNCAGARALPDSSSSLPMVNCRDDSPDSESRDRQPSPQSLTCRSSPQPRKVHTNFPHVPHTLGLAVLSPLHVPYTLRIAKFAFPHGSYPPKMVMHTLPSIQSKEWLIYHCPPVPISARQGQNHSSHNIAQTQRLPPEQHTPRP